MKTYVDSAAGSLSDQLDALPQPRSDETMILGFSDLHCNQAMTELIARLAHVTKPVCGVELGRRHGQWDGRRARLHPA